MADKRKCGDCGGTGKTWVWCGRCKGSGYYQGRGCGRCREGMIALSCGGCGGSGQQ